MVDQNPESRATASPSHPMPMRATGTSFRPSAGQRTRMIAAAREKLRMVK